MKKISETIVLIMLTISMSAQNFAPVGAEWYYTKRFDFNFDISYSTIKSIKDTIIKDKDCRILTNDGHVMCGYYSNKFYVYDEDSVVYFYLPELDTFQMLYNFKVKKDSSWTFLIGDEIGDYNIDTIMVTVNNVDRININNKELKKLNVTYSAINSGYDFTYESEIIEKIGDTKFLFNIDYILVGMTCDGGSYTSGLRCYEDSLLGLYSSGITNSCTYTDTVSIITKNNFENKYKIYPNPSNGLIEIKVDYNENILLEVHNLLDKKLLDKEFNSATQINISDYSNGLYLLILKQKNNIIGIKKIIKN